MIWNNEFSPSSAAAAIAAAVVAFDIISAFDMISARFESNHPTDAHGQVSLTTSETIGTRVSSFMVVVPATSHS
jgi:hypothetical protein